MGMLVPGGSVMREEAYYLWRGLFADRNNDHGYMVFAATSIQHAVDLFSSRNVDDAVLIEMKRGRRLYGWHEMTPADHQEFIHLARESGIRRIG